MSCTQAIVVDDTTVAPAGAAIRGTVLEAMRSGRVEGRAATRFIWPPARR